MWHRHKVRKCSWENGADRLVPRRVATKLQFVKNAVSAKLNKTKCNKRRHAYIYSLYVKNIYVEEAVYH